MVIATVIWMLAGVVMLLSGITFEYSASMITGAILVGSSLISLTISGGKK